MSWMRALGSTGIEVSALGLGTVKLGRREGVRYPKEFALPDDRSAKTLLNTALGEGINLLDTAPAYGSSEERLGNLLRGQRQNWIICSKAGEEFSHGDSQFNFTAEHITASVHRSLKRLQTDVIDILLLHSNGEDLDILHNQGSLEALNTLKQDGLIRATGMSTKTIEGGLLAANVCDVVMLTYNLDQQDDVAVLNACAAAGKGALVKKALASGHFPKGQETEFLDKSMRLVMGQKGTSSALVGTLSPEHLSANIALVKAILD